MNKKIILILLAILLIIGITACSSTSEDRGPIKNADITQKTGLVYIKGSQCLVYNQTTKIVYLMFEQDAIKGSSHVCSYLTPYISENGYYYKYVDEKIIEVRDILRDIKQIGE